MTTERPESPGDPPPSPTPPKKRKMTQSSYLALGIVFLAVGIGMSFGDSSTWVTFVVLGITFLAISASPMANHKRTTKDRPETD